MEIEYKSSSIPDPPVIIHLDGAGSFTAESLPVGALCPETHFRCPGSRVYCMSVYLRCNGVPDCLGHQDEEHCHRITCPGYYR